MIDREFNTNMNDPIDDRTALYVRGGLAYILRPGKRSSLTIRDSAA
jgi:hypothetical protein